MEEQIMIMLNPGLKTHMGFKNLCSVIFISLIIFQSCSFNINTALQDFLKDADEVKIYINKGESENKSIKVITITSKDTIKNILSSITDEDVGKRNCVYTGSIEFFHSKISLINMEFSLSDECKMIVFQYKGNIFRKVISKKGIELLKSYVY